MDIHTDTVYIYARYDVTIYLRSKVTAKQLLKTRLRWLLVEFLKNGLSKEHEILQAYRGRSAPQVLRKLRH